MNAVRIFPCWAIHIGKVVTEDVHAERGAHTQTLSWPWEAPRGSPGVKNPGKKTGNGVRSGKALTIITNRPKINQQIIKKSIKINKKSVKNSENCKKLYFL